MTSREKLFERVNDSLEGRSSVFVFTASMMPDNSLAFNAFFEHELEDEDNPPQSYLAGASLIAALQKSAGPQSEDEEEEDDN